MFSETVSHTKQQDILQQLFNHNHGNQPVRNIDWRGSHQGHNSSSFNNSHAANIASNNYKGKPVKVGANAKHISSVIPPVNNIHHINQGNHNGALKPTDFHQNRANSATISKVCETNKQPNSLAQRHYNFQNVTPNGSNRKNHLHQPESVQAWGRSSTENPGQMYFEQISNNRTSINTGVKNMDKNNEVQFLRPSSRRKKNMPKNLNNEQLSNNEQPYHDFLNNQRTHSAPTTDNRQTRTERKTYNPRTYFQSTSNPHSDNMLLINSQQIYNSHMMKSQSNPYVETKNRLHQLNVRTANYSNTYDMLPSYNQHEQNKQTNNKLLCTIDPNAYWLHYNNEQNRQHTGNGQILRGTTANSTQISNRPQIFSGQQSKGVEPTREQNNQQSQNHVTTNDQQIASDYQNTLRQSSQFNVTNSHIKYTTSNNSRANRPSSRRKQSKTCDDVTSKQEHSATGQWSTNQQNGGVIFNDVGDKDMKQGQGNELLQHKQKQNQFKNSINNFLPEEQTRLDDQSNDVKYDVDRNATISLSTMSQPIFKKNWSKAGCFRTCKISLDQSDEDYKTAKHSFFQSIDNSSATIIKVKLP